MLSAQDDFLGHQQPTTFAHIGTSDDRFTERYWYSGLPVGSGDVVLDMGLGLYPNKNVMDGFAGVTVGRKQHNFRASRQLGRNRLEPAIGPLRFEILEGMKRHRVVLEPNASTVAFDLEFQASFDGTQEEQSFRRAQGRVVEDLARLTQFGRWQGWVEVEGNRFEVTPDKWWAQRDHSWGVRSAFHTDDAGNHPVSQYRNFFWFWLTYQFEDFGISLFLKERSADRLMYFSGAEIRRDGTERKIARVEHDFDWADDPLGQTWTGGRVRLFYRDGGTRDLVVTMLPGRFYLKAGMYGGLRGWNHGDDMGPLHMGHDVWDLDDPETRRIARTLGDHATRIETEGQVGYGVSEYGVAEGYPRYQVAQRHPAL